MAGAGVQGVGRLVDTLQSAADQLTRLDDAAETSGALLVQRAGQNAPRRTGYLAAQHTAVIHAGSVQIVNSARYAAAVHARKPWLSHTLADNVDQVTTIYADQVADLVETIEGI
jgi:hypothetical protein